MMAKFLGLFGMIVVGALLIFIASNKNARSLVSKMHLSWHLSNTEGKEADEAMTMGMTLIMGIFIIVLAFVLLILYLLGQVH
jgi:hypothetical protein